MILFLKLPIKVINLQILLWEKQPIANFELSIESDHTKSATKVFYVAGKTTGFDNGYDSKLFSGLANSFSVYTELVGDKQGEKLAIQTLDKDDTSIIPVGVIANVGKEITFSLESEKFKWRCKYLFRR